MSIFRDSSYVRHTRWWPWIIQEFSILFAMISLGWEEHIAQEKNKSCLEACFCPKTWYFSTIEMSCICVGVTKFWDVVTFVISNYITEHCKLKNLGEYCYQHKWKFQGLEKTKYCQVKLWSCYFYWKISPLIPQTGGRLWQQENKNTSFLWLVLLEMSWTCPGHCLFMVECPKT